MSDPVKVPSSETILRNIFGAGADERLFVRLFTSDVDPTTNHNPDAYTDANYVGYNPWSEWTSVWQNEEETAEERFFTHRFTAGGNGQPVSVKGWVSTLNAPGGERRFVVGKRFPSPMIFQKAGDSLDLAVVLSLGSVPGANPPVIFVEEVSFHGFSKGANPMRLFQGTDRALVNRALDTIQRIRRRDTAVSINTAKTRFNRTPIIPTDEGATIDAFNRVETRLNELLAMQRS